MKILVWIIRKFIEQKYDIEFDDSYFYWKLSCTKENFDKKHEEMMVLNFKQVGKKIIYDGIVKTHYRKLKE